ncbi:UDP-forming cellulose synthase catalytic subunit [Pectobacterium atrosepticum]|uniref:UDP-forming cellulose synthase catalytic subunit n=1 Tax=Pectobacterium atrosepticum TaxID=29471 RepID=UPI0005084831|nr:UDP-forming cellulose synthase catalytic subunit [Pectobacterium atrosepticum]KFX13187.1 cellulose synthase [Pectobacterium atrosepticum]KMK82050.1 cellulose synthase catalytic subunit [Pectobacterium atrosepticum ICMP 1526]MBL0895762.1 UDP-forming cellulose synthase catalytic subunit [Pectobacterium atrosepticum]MCL6392710.1 UDP-forming cellulose synthase catalytic subunit [Pectobacterium atrosepticum]MDK9444592.1 UDP-forming cellulose synthase catalytic subunit [Pectobacterium atrosepticu
MSGILRLFLVPPARQAIQQRYRGYRQKGASAFAAFFATLFAILGWIFLRLESDGWQQIRAQRTYWFPHISPQRPRPADVLRYLTQGIWLLTIKNGQLPTSRRNYFSALPRWRQRYMNAQQELFTRFSHANTDDREGSELGANRMSRVQTLVTVTLSLLCAALALLCITQPFDLLSQFIFMTLLWGIAMLVRNMPGRMPTLMMIALSFTVSCRYLWWRYTETLNWDDPVSLVCGLLLLAAETYAWVVLVLGYFQTIWPLNRYPVSLPKDSKTWPTVDLMIPTYNEPLSVVKPTVYAALGIDWPKDKINIYILDDGGRAEFKAFAEEVGVHYIARVTHEHAKAGNINNALKQATGEFVAIFDCDHVPTRSFLQLTMGWFFKDKKLAMLQTPHHFFSPDPFERNPGRFRRTPNEGTLFYGLVQDGNDMWDATFFCGSCAILRRKPLDEINGIAVETVTEDAHTSLRLHRRGYSSAYIRIPQAAGLATESLSAHIGQRIRWARGMVQIFRLDNPLFGKGLKLGQRLCYANAMMHFLSGIPRLIFLTAPLAFLLMHAYIIFAPALAIALYVLPHMVHASLTNSRIQGRYRHSFWSEIYETVLAWYIARPTTVALFNPHKGKFNVTAKGGLVEEQHVDWVITRPYLVLVLLNIAGVLYGIWRLIYGPSEEIMTVFISLLWVVYNMTILGGAVAVAVEAKQVRQAHRVEMSMSAAILRADGHLFPCVLRDYSDGGVGVEARESGILQVGDNVSLLLKRGQQEYAFPFSVTRAFDNKIGLRMINLTIRQHIDFIQCTFARADTWALWQDSFPQDKPVESLVDVLALGFRGYLRLADYAPPVIRNIILAFLNIVVWVVSFIPRYVGRRAATEQPGTALTEKTGHQGKTPSVHETRFAQENLFTEKTVA